MKRLILLAPLLLVGCGSQRPHTVAEAPPLEEMIVCREPVDRGHKLPEEDLVLEPESVGLVYVPFHLESYFYVDSVINAVSLEKTLLDC